MVWLSHAGSLASDCVDHCLHNYTGLAKSVGKQLLLQAGVAITKDVRESCLWTRTPARFTRMVKDGRNSPIASGF